MERLIYLVRFFRVVPPVPPLMATTFTVLTVAVSVSTLLDPGLAPARDRAALTPILLLQAFAASSSFAGPSRRGYYDLLLSRGEARATIAAVHWLMSVVPGITAWLVIAAVELFAAGPRGHAALTSGTIVAMTLVSTIPWAVTVPLPRFAGAVGWLLTMALAATHLPSIAEPVAGPVAEPVIGGVIWPAIWPALWPVIWPVLLVGRDLGGNLAPVTPALVLAVVLMAAALTWIQRSDVPLEAAQ